MFCITKFRGLSRGTINSLCIKKEKKIIKKVYLFLFANATDREPISKKMHFFIIN